MAVADPKTRRTNVSQLVSAYASCLHAAAGERHHIVSPLGAWLLLALAAPLTEGTEREGVERVLGCDAGAARRAAEALLSDPHPALALAVAAWRQGDIGAVLDEWCRGLSGCATTGRMPTQAEANAWTSRATKGQIDSMPVEIDEFARLLLATAISTQVSWSFAFDLVPAAELGGSWASRVSRVMRRDGGGPARVVANTKSAGLVGVSHEAAREGLDVIAVIAAQDVSPTRVIAAAYEVAALIADLPSTAAFIPAFDLPLEGHSWVVRESVVERYSGPKRIERSVVTIPGWTARTDLPDLLASPTAGFAEIGKAMLRLIPPDPRGDRITAAQAATARFDTNGFSAAAVTSMLIGASAARGRNTRYRVIERTVEVRFGHPFAVVAATNSNEIGRSGHAAFRGLPAFGAWVTEPMEPSEPNELDWQGQPWPGFGRLV